MEYPTAFWQELGAALADSTICTPEDFTITVTESHDSENYRIEHRPFGSNAIYFWEGNDWPTVLAECTQSQQSPF